MKPHLRMPSTDVNLGRVLASIPSRSRSRRLSSRTGRAMWVIALFNPHVLLALCVMAR